MRANDVVLREGGMSIVASWLWDHLVVAILLTAILALALIGALALGWNSPRPGRPPDWEAPLLPRRLKATPERTALSLLHHPSDDFTLQVIARPLAGPDSGLYAYGVVYRAQDARRYYRFAIGADGYYAVTRVDGEKVTPLATWQQFPHIERGRRPNRLLVTCVGPSCTFRINDEYAATVEDDGWLSGDVGLWARSPEEAAVLQFRRACVWVRDGRPSGGPSQR